MTKRHDINNGYMKLANTLLDDMMAMDLTGCEMRIIFWVWRNSYGYGRKQTAKAVVRSIARETRMNPGTVSKVLTVLENRDIIQSRKECLSFNKYAIWVLPVGNGVSYRQHPLKLGWVLPVGNEVFPVGNTTNETLKRKLKERGGEGSSTNILIKGTPPRPVSASPSITEDPQKSAVIALAGHYCTVRGLVFVNDAARAVTLRSRAVYYPAADLLTKAGGDSALAQRAINDHAAHYREKGFDSWDLRSVRDDFDKWNTERSKYE